MKRYNLKDDHKQIKKQIKDWELRLDAILKDKPNRSELAIELENMSHEMMSINI